MPIVDDVAVFPNNVVLQLKSSFQTLAPDLFIVNRPLKPTDSTQSVGVFASLWTPDPESTEIGVPTYLASEPTIQTYLLGVQGFVKDMDEERGLRTSAVLSKMLRAMLYRDADLGVSLHALQVQMFGSTERLKRYGIRNQVFDANEISGQWLYLSTIEVFFETETV